jgi:hypothetical protein
MAGTRRKAVRRKPPLAAGPRLIFPALLAEMAQILFYRDSNKRSDNQFALQKRVIGPPFGSDIDDPTRIRPASATTACQ